MRSIVQWLPLSHNIVQSLQLIICPTLSRVRNEQTFHAKSPMTSARPAPEDKSYRKAEVGNNADSCRNAHYAAGIS
jgi:hypothetical protein